jgi:hypothetical protein
MNEEDTHAGHGERASALTVALTRLADTMPDDPYRLEGVHARVRRLRARRRARHAAVCGVAAAAAVVSLVAVRSGHGRVTTAPAAEPTTEPALPACHAALGSAGPAASRSAVSADRRGVKGVGTIVGTPSETAVTIHVDEPATDQPSELTATVVEQTEFLDAGVVGPRPALASGDRVVFAAEEVDGGYQLLLIEVHPDAEPAKDTTQDVTDAKKAEAARTGTSERSGLKATAEVVSVQPGSLTLKIDDGEQAGQVIEAAIGPNTGFQARDTKCSGTDLVAGDTVGVALEKGVDGSYTALDVMLSNG